MRSNLENLLAELEEMEKEEENQSLWNVINIFLCFLTFAVQFLVWQWNVNPDGAYSFKAGNAFLSCSIVLCVACYIKSRQEGGHPLRSIPAEHFVSLFATRAFLGLANVFQMLGLLYTNADIAASLWFSKIIMVAIALLVLKRQVPDGLLGSQLAGVLLGVVLFIMHAQAGDGNLAFGIVLLLCSMACYGFTIVITNQVLSGPEFDDVSVMDRYFYMFLFQIPVYAASILLSAPISGETIYWTDFIPGYGYDYRAWLLILFLVVQFFVGTVVQGLNTELYVVTAYFGNFCTLILTGTISAFIGFDWFAFILSGMLFINSLTYKMTITLQEKEEHEKEYLDRLTNIAHLQKQALDGLRRKARGSQFFQNQLTNALEEFVIMPSSDPRKEA